MLYTEHYIKYRDRGARTVPDRMCAVARYYDISSKADRGDIFIVHDQKSSYRTPLQCTNFLMATSSRIMPHVTKLKSSQTGFLNMTMSSLYSNGLQSPDINPIKHLWDVVEREIRIMDVKPTNLQQLRDAIISIWTKISEECFQHLIESMPRRIKAVLKAKGGPNRY